jgi:peptidyl-prolyl cis-trans isomerase B (cyclophilin B)
MKRVSLVAAATLTLIVSSFTLALAQDATKAATPATPATKAAPATPAAPAAKATSDKAVAAIEAQVAAAKVNKAAPNWKTSLTAPKVVTFDPAKKYFVRMVTTEGTVLIHMLPEVAPMHVTNFLYLTKLGFYDGTVFHRVITGFMAQGGDPLGSGMGGPGYQFAGEFSDKAKHDRPGLLSMANAGPGTDGSQFFLTFVATPWLNGKHTIFGEVVEGMDVLKKLEANGSQSGATSKKMSITKCTVEVQ